LQGTNFGGIWRGYVQGLARVPAAAVVLRSDRNGSQASVVTA
jgi:hypothetical protein